MPSRTMLPLNPIVHAILKGYALSPDGIHGIGHWARVLENGLRLAEVTGANRQVVQLFAIFHDSRRINDVIDTGHGQRGAELASQFRGNMFDLPDDDFELLCTACVGHTDGLTDADITVQTCWDADRLDLGRVGIMPEPKKLCTEAAKIPAVLKWADGRAGFRVVPEFVKSEWGITFNGPQD